MRIISLIALCLLCCSTLRGTVGDDYILFPSYRLPDPSLGLHDIPVALPDELVAESGDRPDAVTYRGNLPTHRWLPDAGISTEKPFTLELWTVDHSHYPTGVLLLGRNANGVQFHVGYYDNAVDVTNGTARVFVPTEWRSAYTRYWRHIVLTVDAEKRGSVYLNGELQGTLDWSAVSDCETWEVAAYNARDPLMRIENILHRIRFRETALGPAAVNEAFQELATDVYNGWRFPGYFHFIAGPSLSFVSTTEAYVTVEADRSTRAELKWGYSEELLSNTIQLPSLKGLHTFAMRGLDPGRDVYYKITLSDAQGEQIDTAILSFTTANEQADTVRFGVIGDTESRPWINDRIAKQLWEAHPDFVVHLGDITDNGERDRKSQWTHEYFSGLEQLQSRIPVFAVPGNGEDDNLYWFQRYFPSPRNQDNAAGYFYFNWGMVDFFMLDSNERSKAFQPGGEQYVWLENQLMESRAPWKVVCFHHPGPPGTYGDEASVAGLEPLFTTYGVQLVLNGHKHTYERSKPRIGDQLDASGTTYIISGGAGGNLKDEAGEYPQSRFTEKIFRNYNYLMIDADSTKLSIQTFDHFGELRDQFRIHAEEMSWADVFSSSEDPVMGWIYDRSMGWIYVGEWPWCYFPKFNRS